MTAYSYDAIRYEARQHIARLENEAAAERLARQLTSASAPTRMDGLRWLRRLRPGWVARVLHPEARAPMAARLS